MRSQGWVLNLTRLAPYEQRNRFQGCENTGKKKTKTCKPRINKSLNKLTGHGGSLLKVHLSKNLKDRRELVDHKYILRKSNSGQRKH